MIVIGIDPGLTGAVATLDTRRNTISTYDMPVFGMVSGTKKKQRNEINVPELVRHLAELREQGAQDVFLERVHALPNEGVTSAFRFGVGFGVVQGAVAGVGLRLHLVTPAEWRRVVRVPMGKDGSRARATQLFPVFSQLFQRVKDHGRADAALLAYFGHRTLDDPF